MLGQLRDDLAVRLSGIRAASKYVSRHRQAARCRVEEVKACIVDDCPRQLRTSNSDDARQLPAVAEAADHWPVEPKRINQGDKVVGEQVVRDQAAWMLCPTGPAQVRRKHAEVFGERRQ